MSYRSSINRFGFPQTSTEWEQLVARLFAVLAKVPLDRWQFLARLLLVIALSFSLATLFWLVLPAPAIQPVVIALPPAVNHGASDGQAINISQLKSLSIFGKTEAAAPKDAAPVPESQATDTHLNLVLMGLLSSNDEKMARAVISSGDKQDVYGVGDALPVGNGVTLSKVMFDRVIINNNGSYESLWLYQNDPNAGPISQSYAAPPPVATDPRHSSDHPGMGPQMQTPLSERGPGYDAPERVVTSDPASAQASRNLSDVVAMSIYREGGQVVGYKIRPGRDAEKFKTLGLQTDDIVTAVNGMPLTNPAKIMEVYKNMGNTTSASLEIKRGGSVMTIDVVLQ